MVNFCASHVDVGHFEDHLSYGDFYLYNTFAVNGNEDFVVICFVILITNISGWVSPVISRIHLIRFTRT